MSNEGEIIITPFWRQDIPLIRFNTRDYVKLESRKRCPCPVSGDKVFRGILKRTDNSIKIGASFITLDKLYEWVKKALFYQYPFDRAVWWVFTKPRFILLLCTAQHSDSLLLFIDRTSFLSTLRTKRHLIKSMNSYYGVSPVVHFVDKKDIDNLFKIQPYYDLRYVKKHTLPQELTKILDKLNINIS